MDQDRYEFVCRSDAPDRAMDELRRQELDFQVAFYAFVDLTNRYGWDERERIETLDDRFQTYAIPVDGGDPRRAMLTREVGAERYAHLGLTRHNPCRDEVCAEACKAHNPVSPRRAPYP